MRRASSLSLAIHAATGKRFVPFLRRHLHNANPLLPHPLRDLSVALVNDRVMSDLHVQFMNIKGPTDVLTFPMDERGGEVIICVPEATRRAKEHRAAVQNELLLYAIHGMLHLCGMDDRTRRGFEDMHQMEDQILTKLGVGAVFRPGKKRAGTR
jgi:rRNA maturation RNase YbeY